MYASLMDSLVEYLAAVELDRAVLDHHQRRAASKQPLDEIRANRRLKIKLIEFAHGHWSCHVGCVWFSLFLSKKKNIFCDLPMSRVT